MENGSLYAFINFKQAAGFGHVAWGYQVDDNLFRYGSADHLWRHDWWDLPAWLRYLHVPPGGHIDWWCEEGTSLDMLQSMKTGFDKEQRRHIFYHAFKQLEVKSCSVQDAIALTCEIEKQGWHLFNQNCVQQAHMIFSSYSSEFNLDGHRQSVDTFMADVFSDPLNLIPKTWFARLPGRENLL